MAKFYGEVGFCEMVEVPVGSGVFKEQIIKKNYYGDVLRNNRKLVPETVVNDNMAVDNRISIVADPYANEHFFAIRYAIWQGTRWRVSNVEVEYPRLILTLGGVYNGPTS